MSGTSMDGVDLAYCIFQHQQGKWTFSIEASETIPYEEKWRLRLSQLYKQSAQTFVKAHTFYGHYLGKLCADFIRKHDLEVDFIASHGHTVFHQPQNGFTAQIGDGSAISAISKLPVINDFRLMDVAYHGQGAPLVPIGDRDLFSEYTHCLNLGGFANISFDASGERKAFDIAPCNIILNRIARKEGFMFDEGGQIASRGVVIPYLLEDLNNLVYYHLQGPKSSGREWINAEFWPVVRDYMEEGHTSEDLMRTLLEHIAVQITKAIDADTPARVLITGGGALNDALIKRLRALRASEFVVPEDRQIIEFKEALIFAYLGVLRLRQQENCLSSITGAKQNSVSGAMWGDFSSLLNK